MKKGLLSILASALLVVGCQNYDDQFTLLENQISALSQTVDGLSQVQSTLATLSGTVNSLSSTVSGLGDAIDTAVAEGLADIQEDITAIEAAVEDVASSDAVEDLADAVASSQEDLDELLANSSVFTGTVTVNSTATLDAFHAMGSSLNIVNGIVKITNTTALDSVKVQALIDNILTVTEDFTYTGGSTEAMPTFKNLTGVQSITIKGAGDYRLDNLVSAGNIVLDNTYSSKVKVVHLGALTSYSKLSDQNLNDGTVDMGSAMEFHLTSLAIPTNGKLDITTKKGATLALSAITGLNSLGTTQVMDLDFDGPASVELTTILDGAITLDNVATATISDFYGAIDINAGVENLTVTKGVTLDIDGATDLEVATINMVTDYDPLLTTTEATAAALATAYKDVTFNSQNLITATVSGKVGTLTADAQNNLTTLTVSGHATALSAINNTDLETLTVTDATIGNVTADNNDNMINLTLDHTSYVTTADPGTTVSVDGNADLETLTIDANLIDNLSIQLNPDLITITAGSTLLAIGGTTATVAIDNNDLTAVKATDNFQASTATVDAGVYDDGTSGMKTFKTYLAAAAAAPSATGVKVFFDNISSYSVQGNSATATYTDTAVPTNSYVDSIFAVAFAEKDNATSTGRTTRQSVTLVLPVARDANGADKLLGTSGNKDEITVVNGIGGTKTFAYASGSITTVDQLVAAMNGDTTVPGVTVSAARDAFKQQYIQIAWTTSDGTAGVGSATVTGKDKIQFSYGTDPTTGAAIASQTTVAAGVTTSGIATAIAAAINSVTDAYQASATVNGRIKIVALTSNTLKEDNSSLAHAFNNLTIDQSNNGSTTFLFAGNNAKHILAASASSNTTAIASSLYNLTTPGTTYSGVRVTAVNNSDATNLGSMNVTVGIASQAFAGNSGTTTDSFSGLTGNALLLTAGSNIVAASINSSTLDFVSAFSNVENPVSVASTAGTTNRTGWLGS
ncbi:hypothetical protein N9H53_00595 [Flavobacteriaceae bacterium]|nr:hypothetical protein [Flavobacteriaceae bacterium]